MNLRIALFSFILLANIPFSQAQIHKNLSEDPAFLKSQQIAEYGMKCIFKSITTSPNWKRPGVSQMDFAVEELACKQNATGADTLIVCKYMHDSEIALQEKAGVMWLDERNGFMQSFEYSENGKLKSSGKKPFETREVIVCYLNIRPDTIYDLPEPEMVTNSEMGLSVQVLLGDEYYCERIPDKYLGDSSSNHPKAVFWRYIALKMGI